MSDNAGMNTGPEPLPERLISDVETLRALSDPLRLRILEIMTARNDETFTVKRLATDLGTSQTKLYHHINTLAERGLINVAGQRIVSGIIETSYRVGQRNLRFDRKLLSADEQVMHEALTTIFDGARDDIERGLRTGHISTDVDADPATKLLLARGLVRLAPERAVELRDRLTSLFEEYAGDDDEHADLSLPAYGVVLSLYALAEPSADEESDR